jgi:hypothetical protein
MEWSHSAHGSGHLKHSGAPRGIDIARVSTETSARKWRQSRISRSGENGPHRVSEGGHAAVELPTGRSTAGAAQPALASRE